MTSVASEAVALLNRPTPSSRAAAPKSGQEDGGFAALMDSQTDRRDDPKPARAERNQPRRVEREAPSDKAAAQEPAAKTDAPAPADKNESAAQTATDKLEAGAGEVAKPAGETAPSADETDAEGTDIISGIVPAIAVDPTIATPALPVVAAPVAVAEAETPAAPVEAPPIPTTPPAVTAPGLAAPAIATPAVTAPGEQPPADTTGQTAPAEVAATPDTPVVAAGQSQETAATPAPQVTDPTKAKPVSQNASAPDTATDNETDIKAVAAENTEDATPKNTHPTAQHQTNAATQAQTDKPVAKPEHSVKADDLLPAPKLTTDHPIHLVPQMAAHGVASTTATPQASPVSTSQAVPLNAIAVEIAGQAKAGNSRFEIRLDPPELGRIDVRLDVDKDGNVTSRLVIERADTYDLLRRDQSTLERALQQAGLKTSDNALEFSLRDQGFAQQQRQDDETPRGIRTLVAESDVMPSEAANGYARLLGGRSGVDIRV